MSRMQSSNYKPGGPQKRTKRTDVGRKGERSRKLSRGQQADAARYGARGQDIAEADREARRGSTQRGRAAESARLSRKRTKRTDVGRKGERSRMPSQAMSRRPMPMGAASVNPQMLHAMEQLMGRRPVDPGFDSSQAMSRRPMPMPRPEMGAASVNPRMMDAVSRRPMPMPGPEMGAASVNPRMMDAMSRRPMPMPRPDNFFSQGMSRRPMPMPRPDNFSPQATSRRPMPMGFDPQRQAMERMLNMQMGGRRFRSPFER